MSELVRDKIAVQLEIILFLCMMGVDTASYILEHHYTRFSLTNDSENVSYTLPGHSIGYRYISRIRYTVTAMKCVLWL